MTRTAHYPHPTPAFPVYCLDWADNDTLLLGGGGGATRSGIQNMLKLCKLSKDGKSLDYVSDLALSNEEDAPMTMAVDKEGKRLITGINSSSSEIQEGKNQNCRVFSYDEQKIGLVAGGNTITAEWSDDYPYQKLTALSPSAKLLAVGSTDDKVSLLHFPSLENALPSFSSDAELVDISWGGPDGKWFAVTTTTSLHLYHLSSSSSPALVLKQTLFPPSLDIVPVQFRSSRFSTDPATPLLIHSVLNATKPAKRGAARKAWVCNFGIVAGPSKAPRTPEEKASEKEQEKVSTKEQDVGKWDVLAKREVAGKPVTVFDISSDGKLLAYGCSDLSIGIFDSKTLAPLLKILHAHSFPPTALKFNPSASMLVSASADNTVRVIVVPDNFNGLSASVIMVLIAILILILALALRR